MSTSLNHFNRGLERAFARAKEQQAKQHTQQEVQVQKIDSNLSNANAITNITSHTNTVTQQSSDEQYQATIIQLMVNHIRQKKELNHD